MGDYEKPDNHFERTFQQRKINAGALSAEFDPKKARRFL